MSLHCRLLSCVALLAAVLAVLGQFRPAWAADMCLDWWSLPELREEVRRAEVRAAEQQRASARVLARNEARERATRELLAGRLTLTQAAARFRDANASCGAAAPPATVRAPAATEEERLCREVIGWAEATAERPGQPGSGRPTRTRLEAELNALLERSHGLVR